jgi:predicted  nucleic acid-binding Zn-ribbon protein
MPHQSELEEVLRACYHEFGLFRNPPGTDPQSIAAVLDRLAKIQTNTEKIMTTLAEFQTQMDNVKAAVTAETDLVTAVKTALDAATASIANLQTQIAALQAAGAGAVTQAQLDSLAQEATDTLAVQQQNNASLAALAPQNTTAAPAP